jgi:hypothetical protein
MYSFFVEVENAERQNVEIRIVDIILYVDIPKSPTATLPNLMPLADFKIVITIKMSTSLINVP